MHKQHILLVASLVSLTSPVLGAVQVHAIGPSPAFEKTEDVSQERLHDLILQDVKTKIQSVAPAMEAGYVETPLNKVLVTDYKEIDYPSEVDGTDEGVNSEGQLVLSALKKPITEQSRIKLAELVRYYQYVMSSATTFEPMQKSNGVVVARQDEAERKLNYFDYVKLIDAIADNSQYSKDEKVKRLAQVEKDLTDSISVLYGDSNVAQQLQGWGKAKSVTIPFKRDKFSYKQLLAAYEKNDVIIATLSYYSSILDTLEAIRQYSVNRRLGKPANIDTESLAANVNAKYEKVTEALIQPVADLLSIQLAAEEQRKAGEEEESKALQEAGVSTEGS